jgi:hypothetical protein
MPSGVILERNDGDRDGCGPAQETECKVASAECGAVIGGMKAIRSRNDVGGAKPEHRIATEGHPASTLGTNR